MKQIDWSTLRYDKRLHVGVSFVVTIICYIWFALSFGFLNVASILCAIIVTSAIGVLKEILDQIKYEGFDFMDLAADCAGILIATIPCLIIILL